MNYFHDKRGSLGVIDDRELPFKIKRVFWITNVPAGATRGNHSHKDCQQAILCLSGSFIVTIDRKKRVMFSDSGMVLAPAGSYIQLSDFAPDTVCLVLCSEYYNASDVYQPENGS